MRHLKAFHIFHVAAASSSYSEAAEKLCITHGAVSKQIKVLEAYLSQPLFYRQGRNVALTPAGEQLRGYTTQAFQALTTGVDKLAQTKKTCLEVSCEPTLTMRWLMPRLSDFYDNHPGADIRLSTAGGPVTLGDNGLSLAIRRDDFSVSPEYQQTPLVDEWVGPVVSPDYWRQVKNDLNSLKLLHSQTRPHAWAHWQSCVDGMSLSKNTQQTFAHFYFCIQGAIDGLGAAIGSYPLVADDLARGHLIAPFGFVLSGHRYLLLQLHRVPEALEQAFIHWLEHALSDCLPPQRLRKKNLATLSEAYLES
ncbi:LysR family transcriptional regulator [Kistimonas asteriae]|uniref:LysR family transcriptional regulator n=1 Tax=Kistimonas asteriae TaxID=517724 RepID=UPI001BAB8D22|nr:LysR family transcriptional regulator [Kistimonas asteriae]